MEEGLGKTLKTGPKCSYFGRPCRDRCGDGATGTGCTTRSTGRTENPTTAAGTTRTACRWGSWAGEPEEDGVEVKLMNHNVPP